MLFSDGSDTCTDRGAAVAVDCAKAVAAAVAAAVAVMIAVALAAVNFIRP